MIARGRTAEIFSWEDGKVLKLFHDWCPRQWTENEAKITDLVYRADLPVPRVFETIEWSGRRGIVFEKIDGISMLDACIANPQHVEEYGRLLADLQHKIHNSSIEFLPDLLPVLVHSVRKSKALSAERKQMVLDLLENQPKRYQLCHMDFHPDQVLITKMGPRVIDWETACQGNPLADVARTSLIVRIGQIPRAINISNQELDRIRESLLSAYLDQYFKTQTTEIAQTMNVWDLVAAIARLAEGIDEEEQHLELITEEKIKTCGEI